MCHRCAHVPANQFGVVNGTYIAEAYELLLMVMMMSSPGSSQPAPILAKCVIKLGTTTLM